MNAARIVLIEDNPADVLLVELALTENCIPCELTKFTSGRDALSTLCPQEATFVPDAILLDLNTPRSDGFQVLMKLQQCPRFAHVPIAIITSSAAPGDKHRSALQGVRYIQKPSHLDEFLSTVGQAVKEMLHA